MIPVAEVKNVKLYCPTDGRYSFFNSPYPAHKEKTSIDIYPDHSFGNTMPSPVSGMVELIRKVKAPKGHGFEASDHDTVVVISNHENPETITKLLHLDPLMEVGDTVKIGEPVGVLLRSGYYGWGTSAHVHVEIRSPYDPIRARGGYVLKSIQSMEPGELSKIAGNVVHLQPEYAFIELKDQPYGLRGMVNGNPAILDGGIPYYGWLGAHIRDPPEKGKITITDQTIGDVTKQFNDSCISKLSDFTFKMKGKKILGISLTISPRGSTQVKVIPLKMGGLDLEVGEWVEVHLES